MKALIVSRHRSTVDLLSSVLRDCGIEYEVKEHIANASELTGYDVVLGNIPLSLLIDSDVDLYIQVNLVLPKELRGKELTLEELKKYVSFIAVKRLYLERLLPPEHRQDKYYILRKIGSVKDLIKYLMNYDNLGGVYGRCY